jgi:hypothetical protein
MTALGMASYGLRAASMSRSGRVVNPEHGLRNARQKCFRPECRRQKTEGRKKSEVRSPNGQPPGGAEGHRIRPFSDFGFRPSFGFQGVRAALLAQRRFLHFLLALRQKCLLNRQRETEHRVCTSNYRWPQWSHKPPTKSRQEFDLLAQTLLRQTEKNISN